ncbi:MAG: DUF4097 family beta strand repeat protein [Ignavibacteria bacterium]|nr:DUF4097 family beta strand repeat protein [Ignavibacteria bacterium]
MKTLTKILLVLFGAFLITGGLSAQNVIFEKSYDTESNKKLDYSIIAGSISVKAWESNQVKIIIRGKDELKDILKIKEGNSGGNINVKVKIEENGISKGVNLSSEIYVPSNFNVDIKTAGGDLLAENINGKIDFKTAGGEIKISNTKGELDIKTAGGNISVKNHSGDVDVRTAGGEVDITSANGEIKVSTMGGNIGVNYSGENEGIKLSTMGGNIDIKIPSDTKADVKLSTMSGEIKVDFDLTNEKKSENSLKGQINGGGESIKCSTMGGNISILK